MKAHQKQKPQSGTHARAASQGKTARSAYLILPDIRSVYNVGSAFRTADAAGISHIYLCGVTPTPIDRFDRPRSDLAKVALGAERMVPWIYEKSAVSLIAKLKKRNITIIGIEQSARSVDYKKIDLDAIEGDIALIFGSEVEGISPAVLKKCDLVAEIPMRGAKESLNVSVSIGIVLYRLLDRN